MPSAFSCATLRCVAGFVHICTFIVGATRSGQLRARHRVDSRSSPWPCASFAMKSADAGATRIASTWRERSMCPIAFAAPECHRSVKTGLPDKACSVIGAMNCVAAAVITTSTAIASLMSKRVSSAALYAAMPPVIPSTMRRKGRAAACVVIRMSSIWSRGRARGGSLI